MPHFFSFDSIYPRPGHDGSCPSIKRGSRSARTEGGAGPCGDRSAPPDSWADASPLRPPTPSTACRTTRLDAWRAATTPAPIGRPSRAAAPARLSLCTDVAIDPRDPVTYGSPSAPRDRHPRPPDLRIARRRHDLVAAILGADRPAWWRRAARRSTPEAWGQGLFVSRDGGQTWTRDGSGITAGDQRRGLVAQHRPDGGAGRRLLVLTLLSTAARTRRTAATAARTG